MRAWISAAVLSLPFMASAETVTSVEKMLELALGNDPQLAAQALQAQGAHIASEGAGQWADPRLKIQAANLLANDPGTLDAEPMTQLAITYSQPWRRGKSRELEAQVASDRALLAEAYLGDQRLQVVRQVSRLWAEGIYQQQRQALLAAQREVQEALLGIYTAEYRVGRGDAVSIAQLESRLARQEGMLLESSGRLDEVNAALAFWGQGVKTQFPPRYPQRWNRLPEAGEPLEHPLLEAMRIESEQARHQWQLSEQSLKPDWTVEVGVGLRENRDDFVSVGASRELALFSGKRREPAITANYNRWQASHQQLERQRRLLVLQLQQHKVRWQSLSRQVQVAESQTLPALVRAMSLAKEDYQSGQRAQVRSYESKLSLLDEELRQAQRQYELAVSWIDYAYASGEYDHAAQ